MMDIRTEKLRLIELLLYIDNPSFIKKIKTIFQSEETKDIWELLNTDQKIEMNLNNGKAKIEQLQQHKPIGTVNYCNC